jgi:integrase
VDEAGRPAEGYLTKQAAQRELDAILADARRHRITSQPRLASTVTFAEAAAEWLRYVEHDRKRRPSTITDYRWIVERRLLPDFGEFALESVTTQRIDNWRVELVAAGGIADGEGLSARTINKYLGVMHGILKRAQRTYGLAANAAAWAERQPVSRPGDFDVLSAAEVEALARVAREGATARRPSTRPAWSGGRSCASKTSRTPRSSSPPPTPACASASCAACAGATSPSASA